jgi:hypothetical protein
VELTTTHRRSARVKWSLPKLVGGAKIRSNSPEIEDHLVSKGFAFGIRAGPPTKQLLPELGLARYVDMRGWMLLATIGIMAVSCTPADESAGLIRDGATSVLIQQYGGLNDQPPLGLLASIRVTDSSQINSLVHELDALPAYPSGTMFCPMDDGSYFAITFSYGDASSAMVKAKARGCQGVYVGASKQPAAWAAKSPELFAALRGLVAQPTSS